MKKEQLLSFLSGVGLGITHSSRARKATMLTLIEENWHRMASNASSSMTAADPKEQEEKERKQIELDKYDATEHCETTIGMNLDVKIQFVNRQNVNEFVTGKLEPEPEESKSETWSNHDQFTLDFLNAMYKSGINMDSDMRMMLWKRKSDAKGQRQWLQLPHHIIP